jgi:APA family basic amino acid/polyamine antiporter
MEQALPLGQPGAGVGATTYACAVIVALSALNLGGIRLGALAQNWLSLLEAGLLLIAAAALSSPPASASAPQLQAPAPARADGAFGLAMVFVLLTYGGWNEAAYISAELRDGRRNMVRALALSVLAVTVLYLLVNWGYYRTLGLDGMAASSAPAADVMRRAFGPAGERAIALLVALSTLTSINGTMIVGARSSYALGLDWRGLRGLGRWDGARGTPAAAMLAQGVAALLLVGVGTAVGSGFKAMVEYTAPVFWLFFLLTGIALFVLRRREPDRPRPFRVPLFPLLPLLFCTSCAYMLWSSLSYVYSRQLGGLNAAWIGVAVLALGLVLLAFLRRTP